MAAILVVCLVLSGSWIAVATLVFDLNEFPIFLLSIQTLGRNVGLVLCGKKIISTAELYHSLSVQIEPF
jgi:hypothetical protein